jgi:protein phosphatase 2C family protein 2/3
MGQTLSEPITAKETASLQNSQVKVGSSSMQGWRVSMEDAHTHILKLPDDPEAMFFGGKHKVHVEVTHWCFVRR